MVITALSSNLDRSSLVPWLVTTFFLRRDYRSDKFEIDLLSGCTECVFR